jgi:hypothetical protein
MQPVATINDFVHGADDLQSPWSQIRVMRVTAHADHSHLDPAAIGLRWPVVAIRVYGIQSKVSRNYRDKGPTEPAGAAPV